MMRHKQFTIIIFLLISFAGYHSSFAQKKPKWKLVWHDEFTASGKPDSSKWSFAPRKKAHWACYCTDDTATAVVKSGNLILRGILSKDASDTVQYQTGCIQTKDKFYFRYGKLEVRAKLDKGKGSWPAIWLMPQESVYGGWPSSGEIDVMEHLNYDTFFYQTLHSDYIDRLMHKNDPKYFATAPFRVGEYNVFGMEWYPEKMDFFINGKKTFFYPKITGDTTGKQWPFDQDFFIILDQALGGNWVGAINDATLPMELYVDYVRVYQLKK